MSDLREDTRPLSDFYPDDRKRCEAHYAFAHTYLPEMMFCDPAEFFGTACDPNVDVTRFIQSRWMIMEEMAGLLPKDQIDPNVFRRVADLTAWREAASGRQAVFVEMPMPTQPPLAFYAAAVAGAGEATPARYITLELTFGRDDDTRYDTSRGVLCEWNAEQAHLNSGLLVPSTQREFVRAVEERL